MKALSKFGVQTIIIVMPRRCVSFLLRTGLASAMLNQMLKPATAIVTVVLLMILTVIISIHILIEKHIGPRVDTFREEQHMHLKEYLEDAAVLEKDPVFARPATESADAGPYLNTKLRWSPLPDGARPPAKDVLVLPEEWREDIISDGGRWMRLFFRYNPQKIDFSLFVELRKYDHWRIDENSPISDLMALGHYPNSVGIPLPNLTDLAILARLYLMRALENDNALESLQDVRHVALLLLSTEHVETEMAGISLLKTERHAYNYFAHHGFVDEKEWTPVSEESVLRAQRVYIAERTYLHLWTTDTMLQTVFIQHHAVGLCATVNDAVSDDWSLSGMLRPRLWPEEDLDAAYANLLNLVDQALNQGCRLTFIKAKIVENRFPVEAPVPWFVMRTPFVRRLFGLSYATLPPSGFTLTPSTDSN